MKKIDKKTTVLRIFEKSDGEKVYVLQKDGFYELREKEGVSFWKNLDITEDIDPFFSGKPFVSMRKKLSLSVEPLKKKAPLGPVSETKEIYFVSCYIKEVPSSLSLTMDEAIREFGGEDEKSFTRTLTEDEEAYEKAMKDFKIPKGAFDGFYKTPSKDESDSISTATAAEIFSACARGGLKVGGVEAAEPIYAESFLPHLVRAKDEGVRRDIEADTIVIDRGIAVSQGLIREEDGKRKHADVIMGLKVRYAKEGILPMDSGFVIFKERGAKDKKKVEEEKKAEVAEKSDKDAIKDDCRALRTINEEDLKDMSIEELFTLEEDLTHALITIAHTRKERYSIRKDAGDELDKKLSAAFTDAAVAEAKAKAAEREKEEKKAKEDRKVAADAIEPTPYDLLGSVKIDPVLWKKGLSSDITESTEATKKTKESMESEKSRAIRRGSVYIPTENVSGDIPEELICRSSGHAEEIEVKFSDVSRVDKVFREWASGDERESPTLQPEEWLVYVKVYHEDDLDECILRVVRGEVDEMINLICKQRGLTSDVILLHNNGGIREEIKIVKMFSPATGKITMGVEIENLLPW